MRRLPVRDGAERRARDAAAMNAGCTAGPPAPPPPPAPDPAVRPGPAQDPPASRRPPRPGRGPSAPEPRRVPGAAPGNKRREAGARARGRGSRRRRRAAAPDPACAPAPRRPGAPPPRWAGPARGGRERASAEERKRGRGGPAPAPDLPAARSAGRVRAVRAPNGRLSRLRRARGAGRGRGEAGGRGGEGRGRGGRGLRRWAGLKRKSRCLVYGWGGAFRGRGLQRAGNWALGGALGAGHPETRLERIEGRGLELRGGVFGGRIWSGGVSGAGGGTSAARAETADPAPLWGNPAAPYVSPSSIPSHLLPQVPSRYSGRVPAAPSPGGLRTNPASPPATLARAAPPLLLTALR